MNRKFDLLVFDWDGTLADSTGVIVRAMQMMCRDLDMPAPSDDTANYVIGMELSHALRYVLPELTEESLPFAIERYRTNYLALENDIRLFDGIGELIRRLHKASFSLAVATGKNRRGLERVFSSLDMRRFFLSSRCGDECFSKPHPQMLEELIDEIGAEKERTLMIGDTTHDLQMAINAEVAGVAVCYGAHPAEELRRLKPLACLSHVGELDEWLSANA